MTAKHNHQKTLESIAAELTALATDLAQGKLRVGSRFVSIGNPLFSKTKQKITGETAYCTLSFQVPLRDSDKESQPITDQKHAPKESRESRHDQELRLQGGPPEGKKIKKEIVRLWKTVSRKLEQGQAPTPSEEKALVAAFENYCLFSEPAWHEDWLDCFKVLREALACARRGDMSKALGYAAEVNVLTKTCHKKYK